MLIVKEISYNDKDKLFHLDIEGEKIYLSYEELEAYKLSIDDEINFDTFNEIKNLSSKNKALIDALKYISNRLLSSDKVKTHLIKKGHDKIIIDRVIRDLKDNKIIDDETYLEYYIKDKINVNLRSKKHIKFDLKAMNFDEVLIDTYLEAYDSNKEIKVAKKLLERKNYIGRKSKEQIYSYLARRAFNPEVIKTVLEIIEKDKDDM